MKGLIIIGMLILLVLMSQEGVKPEENVTIIVKENETCLLKLRELKDRLSWVKKLKEIKTYSDNEKTFYPDEGKVIVFTFEKYVEINPFEIVGVSMRPTLDEDDIIIVHKPESEDEIKVGTIIVGDVCYATLNGECVGRKIFMHRVWKIEEKDGKTIYYTKGDSEFEEDWWYTEFEDIWYVVDGVIYR